MIERKKKLRLIQIGLLIVGMLIIIFTYFNQNETSNEKIVSRETQEKIKKQLENSNTENSDVFYNIEYSDSRYSIFNDRGNISRGQPDHYRLLLYTQSKTF